MRNLVTFEGIPNMKVDGNRFCIKRQNGGHGLDELASTYNAAIVGLGKYFKHRTR
jgi:hypothetical protein